MIPTQPILEDESAELGTINILESRLAMLIKKADAVASKARQLNYHLKGRKNAIMSSKAAEQPMPPDASPDARTFSPQPFAAINAGRSPSIANKLIFDVEQILELLGATEPILLRIQHIRIQANQSMRIARGRQNDRPGRRNNEGNEGRVGGAYSTDARPTAADHSNSEIHSRNHQQAWQNRSSTQSGATEPSFNDPYGGMKLVPNHYNNQF